MKMIYDLTSKDNERMNCSVNNVECYLYNNHPLLSKEWDYAVIVEVEDNKKTGRVNVVGSNGEEIASLVSIIGQGIVGQGSTKMFYNCMSNPLKLLDKYLPKKFSQFNIRESFEAINREEVKEEEN